MSDSFNLENVWHYYKSFFVAKGKHHQKTFIMLAFQVSTSLWSFFGTSKDFENSSLAIFFSLFAVVLEFWTIKELFCANCRFINKFCRNQLTCSNHVIWIILISFICQIPLTLKMCDIIRSPFFFKGNTIRKSENQVIWIRYIYIYINSL